MKLLFTITTLLLSFTTSVNAQKLKLSDGDINFLKDENFIQFEFTYTDMAVGKFNTEKEYVEKKREDYNKKESGKGDEWVKSWVNDRKNQFEPKFIELFTKASKMEQSNKAKYTLIFKTQFTEPGFNIGIARKNAKINGEVLIVETANKNKALATITVRDALGRTFGGYDFDTGGRIAEAYADAGKALGRFVKR